MGSGIESGNDDSESEDERVEMMTSKPDDIEHDTPPIVLGTAASSTSSNGSSIHSGASFDPESRGPSVQGVADAPTASDSARHGPDQQFATLRTEEAKVLAEHIPGP